MDNAAFDSAPQSKKNFRVHLVNLPSGDNPWRTKQDYLDDQKKMLWSFRMTIVAAISAIVSALSAIALVTIELKSPSKEKPPIQQK
ncbi:MAG: hypothetical protein ORN23_06635 [Chthoniobacterales bacterium]|jgi:hypothetical protein|nr:hypothetical protein [Chthoniobacterales bacterium]